MPFGRRALHWNDWLGDADNMAAFAAGSRAPDQVRVPAAGGKERARPWSTREI